MHGQRRRRGLLRSRSLHRSQAKVYRRLDMRRFSLVDLRQMGITDRISIARQTFTALRLPRQRLRLAPLSPPYSTKDQLFNLGRLAPPLPSPLYYLIPIFPLQLRRPLRPSQSHRRLWLLSRRRSRRNLVLAGAHLLLSLPHLIHPTQHLRWCPLPQLYPLPPRFPPNRGARL